VRLPSSYKEDKLSCGVDLDRMVILHSTDTRSSIINLAMPFRGDGLTPRLPKNLDTMIGNWIGITIQVHKGALILTISPLTESYG
jgi:hypothetical protein